MASTRPAPRMAPRCWEAVAWLIPSSRASSLTSHDRSPSRWRIRRRWALASDRSNEAWSSSMSCVALGMACSPLGVWALEPLVHRYSPVTYIRSPKLYVLSIYKPWAIRPGARGQPDRLLRNWPGPGTARGASHRDRRRGRYSEVRREARWPGVDRDGVTGSWTMLACRTGASVRRSSPAGRPTSSPTGHSSERSYRPRNVRERRRRSRMIATQSRTMSRPAGVSS